MTRLARRAIVAGTAGATLVAGAVAFGLPGAGASTTPDASFALPAGFTATVFAQGGSNLSKPDDISLLGGNVYVAYQNGVGATGGPSSSGQTASTLVEYSTAGKTLGQWNLTGKIDGMSADVANNRIVATVNEDGNSSLYTVTPGATAAQQVTHYTYSTNPLPHGGGTDAITFAGGNMYVSASNPTPNASSAFTNPALYKVTLSGSTATATAVLKGNATATDAVNGSTVTLNLSDPDSNLLMPAAAPRFAGDVMLDSQGDSQQIFLANPGTAQQTATVLKLNTQVDDTAVASAATGTLYLTDNEANQVIAIKGPFTSGQVFAAVPNDSRPMPNFLGTIDLKTGQLTNFGRGFKNPHGLLFVG